MTFPLHHTYTHTFKDTVPCTTKEPRWTEGRLQYVLFRAALHHPLVTSRGIPELLNHSRERGVAGGWRTRPLEAGGERSAVAQLLGADSCGTVARG